MSDGTITLNFAPVKPATTGDGSNAAISRSSGTSRSTRLPNMSYKRKANKDLEGDLLREQKALRKDFSENRPPRNPKPAYQGSKSEHIKQPNKNMKYPSSKEPKASDESSSDEDSEKPEVTATPELSSKKIISSLFTSNPTISKEHSSNRKAIAPQMASNGVLSDAKSFVAAGLDKVLSRHLKDKMSMGKPTTVQSRAISFLASSGERDLIIQAQTGSGKTLSFLLPIVDKLIRASGSVPPNDAFRPSRTSGVLAVILAPTRELARQIYDVLEKLLNYPVVSEENFQRYHWIVPGLVVGGDKKASEKARLRKGVNILVATPGRFLDHLQNTKCMNIDTLKWVVLDEGDRFLELGLQETLKSIFSILKEKASRSIMSYRGKWFWLSNWLPKERLTIMVSATLNSAVKSLAEYSLTNPMHITGDKKEDDSCESDESDDSIDEEAKPSTFATPQQLTQRYVVTPAKLRLVALNALLRTAFTNAKGKVIVFMLTCEEVEFYHSLFLNTGQDDSKLFPEKVGGYYSGAENFFGLGSVIPGLPLLKLHGNLDQKIRSGTYKAFCALESGVLFCTDVAARGLDLPRVAQIIQFDPPTDMKDYVHRVGRTARLGRAGDAILFLLPSEVEYVSRLASLKIKLQPANVEQILKSLCDEEYTDFKSAATKWQNDFEKYVLSSKEVQQQAASALTSSMRAYATHPSSEKDIFHIKKLHVGHWTKSFAIREKPTEVTNRKFFKSSDSNTKSKSAAVPSYASKAGSRPSAGFHDPNSEFSSGNVNSRSNGKKHKF